jgi:hypothetical protein
MDPPLNDNGILQAACLAGRVPGGQAEYILSVLILLTREARCVSWQPPCSRWRYRPWSAASYCAPK